MVRILAAAAAAFPLLTFATATPAEEPVEVDALAQDEQCDSAEEGDCALNAMQLRGKKLSEEAHGSCQTYHCSHSYRPWLSCQCNSGCESHGNCCSDYESECKAPPPPAASPNPGANRGSSPASGKIYGHPDPHKEYPTYDGFTLKLVEEFESPIDLDNDLVWTWSDGGLTEGQVRFTKENIVFEGGKMKIRASRTPAKEQTCSKAEVAEITPKTLSSGEMRTKHNMFRYGRYEAKWKAPKVQPGNSIINGNYISTLFVFRDAKYKHWREIDFEITGDSPYSVTTNVLSADNTDRWSTNIQDARHIDTSNARADFHTYAFEWLPDSITWYIDGRQVRRKTGNGVPVPDKSAKIMMNLWIFEDNWGFGGKEGYNNHYPMESEYEWFRFYQWDGEQTYPCAEMSTSCLTSDDMYLSGNNPCDGIENVGTVYGKPACHVSCHR